MFPIHAKFDLQEVMRRQDKMRKVSTIQCAYPSEISVVKVFALGAHTHFPNLTVKQHALRPVETSSFKF